MADTTVLRTIRGPTDKARRLLRHIPVRAHELGFWTLDAFSILRLAINNRSRRIENRATPIPVPWLPRESRPLAC